MRFERTEDDFIKNFSKDNGFIIYGLGDTYNRLHKLFKKELKIDFAIDKKAEEFKGKMPFPVYNPDEAVKHISAEQKIIIMPTCLMLDEIVSFLKSHDIDMANCCSSVELTTFWGNVYHNRSTFFSLNIPLTTNCTLNCQNCSQLTPYLKQRYTLSYDEVIENIDCMYDSVDYVFNIALVGGETFLYKDLPQVVGYIFQNYENRFEKISIYINGTVRLADESLKTLEKIQGGGGIIVYISDYSALIGERSKVDEIISDFEKHNISYVLNTGFGQTENQLKWFDLGDPFIEKTNNEAGLKNKFNFCALVGINLFLFEKKIFNCAPQWGAYSGGIYPNIDADDYIDLEKIKSLSPKEKRETITNLTLGNMKKGYLSFCKNCNGFGFNINKKLAPAGLQK